MIRYWWCYITYYSHIVYYTVLVPCDIDGIGVIYYNEINVILLWWWRCCLTDCAVHCCYGTVWYIAGILLPIHSTIITFCRWLLLLYCCYCYIYSNLWYILFIRAGTVLPWYIKYYPWHCAVDLLLYVEEWCYSIVTTMVWPYDDDVMMMVTMMSHYWLQCSMIPVPFDIDGTMMMKYVLMLPDIVVLRYLLW